MSENSASFVISYLGIINSGKIVHLIPPEISETNLLAQITSSDSSAIICSENVYHKLLKFNSVKIPILQFDKILKNNDNLIIDSKPNDTAYLIYTSGTTSIPKGVGITHFMVDFTTNNIIQILKYSNSDYRCFTITITSFFWIRMPSYIIMCWFNSYFIKKYK